MPINILAQSKGSAMGIRWRRNAADRSEVASPRLLRRIGTTNAYEGADADDVLRRLRNMNCGSTSNQVSKLRAAEEPADWASAT